MKKIPLSSLVLAASLCAPQLFAQPNDSIRQVIEAKMANPVDPFADIVSYARNYFNSIPVEELTLKDKKTKKKFMRWEYFWNTRVSYENSPTGGSIPGAIAYARANQSCFNRATGSILNGNSTTSFSWSREGPNSNSLHSHNNGASWQTECNLGLVSAVAVTPGNNQVIYVGTNHSGVFKSSNGGAQWSNVTDVSLNTSELHVNAIDINPANGSHLLCALGTIAYGLDYVIESTNGGSSWTAGTFNVAPPANTSAGGVRFKGNGAEAYITIGNTAYKKNFSNSSNWQLTNLTLPSSAYIDDFELGNNSTTQSQAYFSVTNGSSSSILFSPNFASTWGTPTWQTINLPSCANQPQGMIALDVSTSQPGFLFAFWINAPQTSCSSTTDYVVAKMNMNGGAPSSWTILNRVSKATADATIGGMWDLFSGWGFNKNFEVSDQYPGKFVLSGVTIAQGDWTSSNSVIYQEVTDYHPLTTHNSDTHADIRDINIWSNGSSEILIAGCDGGVITSSNGGSTWGNINGSLMNNSQFYSLSTFQGNNRILASPQDNWVKIKETNGQWKTYTSGGESCWSTVNPTNDNHVFYSDYDWVYESNDGGTTDVPTPWQNNPGTYGSLSRKFFPDPTRPGVIYSGTMNQSNSNANLHKTYKYQNGAWSVFASNLGSAVEAFAVAPSNQNVIFEGHGGVSWNMNPTQKVYRTLNGGTTWQDITTHITTGNLAQSLTWWGLTNILVDPLNPNNVFISFSDIGSIRVIKSDNAATSGTTIWTDMSNGLPCVPVNHLAYQNGTDDVIYAATDVGVYRWNKTAGTWEPWNFGLPPVKVTKVEINYCHNKLYASTYGRGAYSCNLPAPTGPLVINSAMSTNGVFTLPPSFNQTFGNSVVVDGGITLNVQGTMAFGPTANLIIEKNAKVALTGMLTSYCAQMWPGVQMEGSTNQLAVYSNGKYTNQAFLEITNNGTIKNADVGVSTSLISGVTALWATHGGVIRANNGKFINNKKDVAFYHHTPNSLCKFTNCIFETQTTLPGGIAPEGHVSMDNISNVAFEGCDFKYSAGNAYTLPNRGYGIYALNSKFYVSGVCTTMFSPCGVKRGTFQNLTRGIYANSSVKTQNVMVTENDLTGIYRDAILLQGMDYASVSKNLITMSGVLSGFNRAGVYMMGCKYYNIRNNTISATGANSDWGVIVNNSQQGAHLIYKNTIDNCIIGVSALGSNAGNVNTGNLNIYQGVKIRCNNFGSTTPNIWDVTQLGTFPTVDTYQGTPASGPNNLSNLVGNKYNASCVPAVQNKWHVTNGTGNPVWHVNNSGANYQLNQPGCASIPPIVWNNTSYSYDAAKQCFDGSNSTSASSANSQVQSALNRVNTTVANENGLIDGGVTNQLVQLASSNGDRNQILSELTSYSPYLSDVVLNAYFQNPIIPAEDVVEVHNQNKPVSEEVWNVIVARNFDSQFQQILDAQQATEGPSARSVLQSETADAKYELELAYADKISFWLTDTLPEGQDTVLATLALTEQPTKVCQAIALRVFRGDNITATQIDDLHGGSQNVDAHCQVQKLLIGAGFASGGLQELTPNSQLHLDLSAIADDNGVEGYQSARSLIEFVLNTEYEREYLVPDGNNERKARPAEELKDETVMNKEMRLMCYPNPSSDKLMIDIQGQELKGKTLNVTVKNALGQIIIDQPVKAQETTEISVKSLINGMYFITVSENEKPLLKDKVIVSK